MRDHLFAEIGKLADTMEPSSLLDDGLGRIARGAQGRQDCGGGQPDRRRRARRSRRSCIDRLTGVMSLLEGHADVVMDGVGPDA